MGSNAKIAGCVGLQRFASTTSGRVNAGNVMEPPFASTTNGAILAVNARVPLSVSMTNTATVARCVRTYHAPFKGAYNLAIALAAHEIY